MSLTKGTLTNQIKLASWDIDYYLSLSDDECLVCLTEKELYLLRNPLAQMEWLTRWVSQQQTSPPNIENIVETLAYKLSGNDCINICAAIIDCVENDSDVQTALSAYFNQTTGFNSPSENTSGLAASIINVISCDPDEIFGNAVSLWETVNRLNIDFLEIINEASNEAELLSDLIELVPIINVLPVDAAFELVNDIFEWLLAAYNAALTVSLENDIQCDLFCLGIDNCELSFEDLLDYFTAYFSIDLKNYTFTEFLDWMLDIATTGTPLVYLVSVFQLYMVATGNKFFGVFFPDFYGVAARLGTPSNDWVLLCDECTELWEHTFDFLASDGGWTLYGTPASGTGGLWTVDVGWQATNDSYAGNVGRRELLIEREFTSSNLYEITWNYNLTKGTWANPAETQFNLTALSLGSQSRTNASLVNGSGQSEIMSGASSPVTKITTRMLSSLQSPVGYSGSLVLTSVVVKGIGVNPFI